MVLVSLKSSLVFKICLQPLTSVRSDDYIELFSYSVQCSGVTDRKFYSIFVLPNVGKIMKKVLNFFSRPEEDQKQKATTYVAKEPTLNPVPRTSPQSARPAFKPQDNPQPTFKPQNTPASAFQPHDKLQAGAKSPAAPDQSEQVPTDYKAIVEYFQKKVTERKSPYNTLVKNADRLKEFIPDETSRLKAVLAIGADQWPPDMLSLAISTHIADIELARTKAKGSTNSASRERALALHRQLEQLQDANGKIADELRSLNEKIGKLETTLNANKETIKSLNEQIQVAELSANSVSFVDQAAENLKNDLLAKKVILGLP
jgi:hypothetical protein